MAPETNATADRITRVSVIDALIVGRYEGVMSIPELVRHGDFGGGTLDHLAGELIVLEGKPHQIRGDGEILGVSGDRSTPFAVVTHFEADGEFACPRVTGLPDLEVRLDAALPRKNNFVAIRIDGRFASLAMRSVRRREPPYRPLDEVARTQSAGPARIRSGPWSASVAPPGPAGSMSPGYHWHFPSQDRKVGGHVLCRRVSAGKVRDEGCRDWEVELEGSKGFNHADLVKDRSRVLHRVERSRGRENK